MFSIFFQFDQKKRKRAVMENKTCANVRPNIHHSKKIMLTVVRVMSKLEEGCVR
jgi:hypothetical protein